MDPELSGNDAVKFITKLSDIKEYQIICLFLQENTEFKDKIEHMNNVCNYTPKKETWPFTWNVFETLARKKDAVIVFIIFNISTINDLTESEKDFMMIIIKHIQEKSYVKYVYFVLKDDVVKNRFFGYTLTN